MRLSSKAAIKELALSPAIKAQLSREFDALEKASPPTALAKQVRQQKTTAAMPQEVLSRQLKLDPRTRHLNWQWDYKGAVPERRYEIDCALVEQKIAIETDGWQYHGARKESFNRDREKDYLLSLEGWVILRIPAGLISKDCRAATERVVSFLDVWIPRQNAALVLNREAP